ncbi:MAG: galactokinase [Sphingomonadales bacterium]|nr:galactokinase [Sphingomonadales bacterium]
MSALEQAFAAAFGHDPDIVARAPGRVNLIGEHTDYNDGFVLPAAIGVETRVAARRREDGVLRVLACDLDAAVAQFPLTAPFTASADQPWVDYVRGMTCALAARGANLCGADLAIAGTIPRGSGLSSSASLAVAVGTVFTALAGLAIAPAEIARAAQAAECDHVGTRCGIMDQLASACGVAGHALLIDCRSLDTTPIALPDDMAVLIVHSGVTRGLVEGAYNERRAQCEAAAAALGVPALRDADMPMLARASLDPVVLARARHVVSENARVLAAAEALATGDFRALGALMAASHASMRDDFQITVPPVDALVAELQALIGEEGGARMTGGGFGGAVVALCRRDRVDAVLSGLTYRRPDGDPPLVLREYACAGTGLVAR